MCTCVLFSWRKCFGERTQRRTWASCKNVATFQKSRARGPVEPAGGAPASATAPGEHSSRGGRRGRRRKTDKMIICLSSSPSSSSFTERKKQNAKTTQAQNNTCSCAREQAFQEPAPRLQVSCRGHASTRTRAPGRNAQPGGRRAALLFFAVFGRQCRAHRV